MNKFTKKPVTIEAVQLSAQNMAEVKKWCNASYWTEPPFRQVTGISITTLEGVMNASFGDYIIKGVKGEFYPCKPDIFEATYVASEKIGELSDGYHTFNELYEHRHALLLALMKQTPTLSWISHAHHDGTEWPGWFIAGIKLPTGDISYHMPEKWWELACATGANVLDRGMMWDGHTSSHVIDRLLTWVTLRTK